MCFIPVSERIEQQSWTVSRARGELLRLPMVNELVQFRVVEVGDGPERHASARPVAEVKATQRARVGLRLMAVALGPHEDVDRVLPALIDERRHGAAG